MGIPLIKGMKGYELKGQVKMNGTTGPMRQYVLFPDRMRMEIELGNARVLQVVNGKDAWSVMPVGSPPKPQTMSETQARTFRRQLGMQGLLHQWKEKAYKVSLDGTEKIRSKETYRIKVDDGSGMTFTLYIGKDDYLLAAQRDAGRIAGQETVTMTYFSGYRNYNGLMVPSRIEQTMNGKVIMDISVSSFRPDPSLPAELFSRPD
jgi:outer membrane lipoprotein-sorting protein